MAEVKTQITITINLLKLLNINTIILIIIYSLISFLPVFAEEAKVLPTKQGDITVKKEEIKAKLQNESLSNEQDKISSDMVLIQTEKGPIKIKLFTKEVPITTSNFIDLIKKGFYNNTVFHRIVENFVIQGGDPLGDGTGNYIDPETGKPRFIKLEVNPGLKFDRPGRVGMARTSEPNSASCQFFIALQALPSLNPGGVDPYGYAVFGQVTDDTFETVKKIVKDSKPAFPGSDRPANPVRMVLVTLQ